MKRTLTLRREALAEIATDDLASVVGGQELSGLTCPLTDCIGDPPTFPPRCYSAPWC